MEGADPRTLPRALLSEARQQVLGVGNAGERVANHLHCDVRFAIAMANIYDKDGRPKH
jgi:hypothetical protein